MANIKDLKVRIKSTKSTLKITSAMKLVSAAKLSKAQAKIQGFKPYSSELDKTVRVASALASDYTHEYLKENESEKIALVIISSEKGLCGGYNSQLFKVVKNFITTSEEEVETFFIGRKVRELLSREGISTGEKFELTKADPDFNEVKTIAQNLSQRFLDGEFGKLYVGFNSFASAIEFNPTIKQVLPLSESEEEKEALIQDFPVEFLYEPSASEILDSLIPEVFNTTFYTCLLDAIAAEHGTRMTAMDNATNNSKDMIKKLTLKANKLRQAAITTELTEIVSGAESLNS